MERLFPRYPQALARTMEIVHRCKFSLEELTYQYPEEAIVPGKDAQASLEHYVWECVTSRYPEGFAAAAEREMATIAEQSEREVALRQMAEGHDVIEDYGT